MPSPQYFCYLRVVIIEEEQVKNWGECVWEKGECVLRTGQTNLLPLSNMAP